MAWKLRDRLWLIPAGPGGLSASEKYTALAIATFTNKHSKTAWPELESVAARSGLSLSTVRRSVRSLERLGLLVVVKRSKGGRRISSEYRFGDDVIDALGDPLNPVTVTELRNGNPVTVAPKPGHGGAKPGHSDRGTLKEPEREPRAPARATDGRAGALEADREADHEPTPTTPDPNQREMLMPYKTPLAEAEERWSAAKAALAGMAPDDPLREAQAIIVKRIENEIAAVQGKEGEPSAGAATVRGATDLRAAS